MAYLASLSPQTTHWTKSVSFGSNYAGRGISSLSFQNRSKVSLKNCFRRRLQVHNSGEYEYVDDEDDDPRGKSKGIFNFVTDNPSSKSAIQLPNSPGDDGNTGQMIASIEKKGRDFGSNVKAGRFRWFVRETGENNAGTDKSNTVVFLHGAPTQSYSWRNVMSQLAEKGYHCFSPDWIGFGFSEHPQPGYGFNYTEDEYHTELDVLLEELNINKPFHLVVQGFVVGSYGLTWALKKQQNISSLTILNTPLSPSSSLPSVFQQLRLPFVGEFVCQNAILAERFVEGGSPYVLEIDDADVYRLPYLNSSAPGFSLLEASRKIDIKNTSKKIWEGFAAEKWNVPTLVAWGTLDKYLNQSEAAEFAARNPKSIRLQILEGAGHLPQEDWAEKVVGALTSSLKL